MVDKRLYDSEYLENLIKIQDAVKSFTAFFNNSPPSILISGIIITINSNTTVSYYARELGLSTLGENILIYIKSRGELENTKIALTNLLLVIAQHTDIISSKKKLDSKLQNTPKIDYIKPASDAIFFEFTEEIIAGIYKLNEILSKIPDASIILDPILISIPIDSNFRLLDKKYNFVIRKNSIVFTIKNKLDCDLLLVQLRNLFNTINSTDHQLPIEISNQNNQSNSGMPFKSILISEIESNTLFESENKILVNYNLLRSEIHKSSSIIQKIDNNLLKANTESQLVSDRSFNDSSRLFFNEKKFNNLQLKSTENEITPDLPKLATSSKGLLNMNRLKSGFLIGFLILLIGLGLYFVK